MKTIKGQFAPSILTIFLFTILCFLLLFRFSQAETAIIITKHYQGKTITIPAGVIFQIQLEEQGGTGYTWKFENFDNEFFELLKVETKGIGREKGYTGNQIVKSWFLKALKKGSAKLAMYYYRPWEDKIKAADRLHIKLKIT